MIGKQQRKKQDWFYAETEKILEKLQDDTRDSFRERGLEFLYSVSKLTGQIHFYARRFEDGEIIWSSLVLRDIVDRDIAVEEFNRWRLDPKPQIEVPRTKSEAPDSPPQQPSSGSWMP